MGAEGHERRSIGLAGLDLKEGQLSGDRNSCGRGYQGRIATRGKNRGAVKKRGISWYPERGEQRG